jgi:hypothetical protein
LCPYACISNIEILVVKKLALSLWVVCMNHHEGTPWCGNIFIKFSRQALMHSCVGGGDTVHWCCTAPPPTLHLEL